MKEQRWCVSVTCVLKYTLLFFYTITNCSTATGSCCGTIGAEGTPDENSPTDVSLIPKIIEY